MLQREKQKRSCILSVALIIVRLLKMDCLHVEVAVVNSEVEIEAQLLLSSKLGYVLRVLQLKWKTFLLLQRVLLLFIPRKCLILFSIDVHAFEHDGTLLNAHFHHDVLEGVRRGVILDREQDSEVLSRRDLTESRDVVEGAV